MSKVFVNENAQPPAPSPKRPNREARNPAMLVVGLVVLSLLGVGLAVWWKQMAMVAAVFLLLGLFTRSPVLAIVGAVTLLSLAR